MTDSSFEAQMSSASPLISEEVGTVVTTEILPMETDPLPERVGGKDEAYPQRFGFSFPNWLAFSQETGETLAGNVRGLAFA